jgi:hypothetical protein
VLSNSAADGIQAKGQGVTIRFKGEYTTLSSLTLNGRALSFADMSDGASHDIYLEDVRAGTISAGSLVVALVPDFVDTLTDGKHELVARFADGHAVGAGVAAFTVAWPSSPKEDTPGSDTPGSGTPAVATSAIATLGEGGSEASDANASEAGTAPSPDTNGEDRPDSSAKGDVFSDSLPAAEDTPAIEQSEGGAGMGVALQLAVVLAAAVLVAAAITIAALMRRRRHAGGSGA